MHNPYVHSPVKPGATLDQIDTPALCLDADALEANIARAADICRRNAKQWRPHSKGHKSPALARLQLDVGAIGVTCAKLGEAEVMAAHGIRDILIANQVVGPQKVRRLAMLRRSADPIVAVDDVHHVAEIADAARALGVEIRLLVEVDIGLARAGCPSGQATLDLAREIDGTAGVTLAGIMGYEGHLLTIEDVEEKRLAIEKAMAELVDNRDRILAADLPCPIVSAGGTGSFRYTVACPGITELQAGGLVMMDVFYRQACQVEDFQNALSLVTTVVSRPNTERVIVDAGRKSHNVELRLPVVQGRDDLVAVRFSAEHGELKVVGGGTGPAIGERLCLVPGYSDLTNVLHDEFYVFRDGRLADVWPLLGRGKIR
ncbi:MAG: DSD1 family PLP-dependent enzyme [Planctomycetales bacterium]|nr:DSD1 family PLP-dependent enzyme [Planctomycetales bacterium]